MNIAKGFHGSGFPFYPRSSLLEYHLDSNAQDNYKSLYKLGSNISTSKFTQNQLI